MHTAWPDDHMHGKNLSQDDSNRVRARAHLLPRSATLGAISLVHPRPCTITRVYRFLHRRPYPGTVSAFSAPKWAVLHVAHVQTHNESKQSNPKRILCERFQLGSGSCRPVTLPTVLLLAALEAPPLACAPSCSALSPPRARASARVFFSSIAIVIGPTPPAFRVYDSGFRLKVSIAIVHPKPLGLRV